MRPALKILVKFRLLGVLNIITLIDVFFDVDSKSTIGFQRPHVV